MGRVPVGALGHPVPQPECAAALARIGFTPFRDLAENWHRVSERTEEGQREFLVQDPDAYVMRFAQPLGRRLQTQSEPSRRER